MTMSIPENVKESNNLNDSDREEGEIIEDGGELSDISSEEEYLLRQRLCILENYNTALQKKKAKSLSISCDNDVELFKSGEITLSDISDNDIETLSGQSKKGDEKIKNKSRKHKNSKKIKSEHKSKVKEKVKQERKRSKQAKKQNKEINTKDTINLDSSDDESYDEYRNKRRRLHNAVKINETTDQKSLKDRLLNMVSKDFKADTEKLLQFVHSETKLDKEIGTNEQINLEEPISTSISIANTETEIINVADPIENNNDKIEIQAELSLKNIPNKESSSEADSDLDLEALRQLALKTKKTKEVDLKSNSTVEKKTNSEEDSDTQELRLICLKSSLLKKAFEIKQKQKLKKKFNKSRQDSLIDDILFCDEKEGSTDIESVDMEVSDNPETAETVSHIFEGKDACSGCCIDHRNTNEDLDEDEDLLRAKLLISLSNSLPRLKSSPEKSSKETYVNENKNKIIINLGDSDSCSDCEATKNLTKMHMKLEQLSFQERLELLLKDARAETEKKQKEKEKLPIFVPKAVNHLPLSDQKEYQMLVKRMAELERMKKQRQVTVAQLAKKPKNNVLPQIDPVDIEKKITYSRKLIAEDSTKVLKLKEEGKKLSQRYKIVVTELKNLKTALATNRKDLMIAQKSLVHKRNYHNSLVQMFNTIPKINMEKKKVLQNIEMGNTVPIIKSLTITVENKLANSETSTNMEDPIKNNIKFNSSDQEQLKLEMENIDDYISPLNPKDKPRLVHDPNIILCKFELSSTGCRDVNCKFLHLNTQP